MRFFFNRQVSANAGRCLFFATLLLFSAEHLQAAEPDGRLFSANADERFSAYQDKTQQLAETLAAATDEKIKEQLILQQDLLAKLKEFPDKAEKPMLDFGLPDLPDESSPTWQHFDLFLQRYADVMKESKKSAANITITTGQMDDLYNKLLALDEEHPDKSILQLQHAIQVRKLEHQKEVDEHLKDGLARAKDEYSAILHSVVPLDSTRIAELDRAAEKAAKDLELLEEKTQVEATSTDVMIQKQESLLANFLGQELSDSAKKSMHFEQLNLLNLKVKQVVIQNQLLKGTLDLLIEKQNLIWFRLLSGTPEFFKLVDRTGDVKNQLQSLREKIVSQQALTHTHEKDVSALGGGNAILGPRAEELLLLLNQKTQGVFEHLSGLDQQAETSENRGILLERAIDLKQSALGSVMTKTREATDNIYEKILSVLRYPLLSYSGMSISLLLMVQLLFLLAVGIIINRIYCRSISRIGEIRKWTERTVHLVQAVGKYPFLLVVAMIILSVVGINTRSLALVAGALSVGVGFGMQTIVSNLVSGIILLFDKSISPGDFISLGDGLQIGGTRGNVVQMNIRATVLRTNDNINVIIPNADLMASQVVNWTYSDEKIRLRIPFSVAYGTDIDRVKALVEKAITGLPIVLSTPGPQIWLEKQTGHSLHYLAAIWVEGPNARQPAKTTDTVLSAIITALYTHGIAIPYPAMETGVQENRSNQFVGKVVSENSSLSVGRHFATQ